MLTKQQVQYTIRYFICFFFAVGLFSVIPVSAQVVINEIAWMGATVSANDEWIELFNPTEQTIDLTGWVLKTSDNKLNIKLSDNINAGSFYLLERTDDGSVAGIAGDLIYSGALSNNGEDLQLYSATGVLIDEVNCSEKWTAGENVTKQTMERVGAGWPAESPAGNQAGWQTSQNPGGTPKATNSTLKSSEKLTENRPLSALSYQTGIVINEVLPSPDGSDETEEWLELKNTNSQEVSLAGWKVKDTIGTVKTYQFPDSAKIPGYGFFVLKRPASKISLNNSGDGLILLWPNNQMVDEASFSKAPLGQSWSRVKTGFAWSARLTPGQENIISQPATAKNKKSEAEAVSPGIKEQAAVGPPAQMFFLTNPALSTLLIALALAIVLAIAILLLKKFLARNRSAD